MRGMCRIVSAGRERLRAGALWGGLILLPVLVLSVGLRAWAADPVGVTAADDQLRAALATMDATFNELPAPARETLAVEVKLLGQSIDAALLRVEQAPVPPLDEALVHDLDFLTDLLIAMTGELRAIQPAGRLDPAASGRIESLSAAATARIDAVDRIAESWIQQTQGELVELENEDGTIVLRTVDRTVHAAVRQTGLVLLLVGLLLVGLQLLRGGQERAHVADPSWGSPRRSPVALGALSLFFVGALVLTIYPTSLSWLAASEASYPQEHPCQRLEAQRERLGLAQAVDHTGLIEARKHRMVPAAQDCLGLPSEQAAIAAVDQLVARSAAMAASAAPEARPMASAEATPAPVDVGAGGVGGPDSESAMAAEEASEPPSSSDVLAELLAALRQPASPSDDGTFGTASATQEDATVEPAAGPLPEVPAAPPAAIETTGSPATSEPGAYTVTTGLNYRTRPTTDSPRLGIFGPGARVRVTGFEDGWAEIELNDGRRVYAFGEFLEPAP